MTRGGQACDESSSPHPPRFLPPQARYERVAGELGEQSQPLQDPNVREHITEFLIVRLLEGGACHDSIFYLELQQ